MKLGISSKFIGIMVIAAILPLAIGLIAIYVLGYQYYRRERGALFQAVADNRATTLSVVLREQVERLEKLVALSDLYPHTQETNLRSAGRAQADAQTEIARLEARWASLTETGPDMQVFLTNSVAREIRTFQSLNPLFAEILVTDATGRLVAATRKTSDYWQADETWWQVARSNALREAYLEGVNFDQSAMTYSIDVALPIRDYQVTNAPVAGVIKGVVEALPLFAAGPHIMTDTHPRRQLVQADGTILFDLFDPEVHPRQQRVAEEIRPLLQEQRSVWRVVKFANGASWLVAAAPVVVAAPYGEGINLEGIQPMFVIVYDDAHRIMAPVRRQLTMVAVMGGALVSLFSIAGLYIARRKIIDPIQTLRDAAHDISKTAKLEAAPLAQPAGFSESATRLLGEIEHIQTGDEIEALAAEFRTMATRVLTYHEKLEEEIAAKTNEIQRDLQFAREFQEALMPRDYPRVASANGRRGLTLNFHHIYKPASSVGGDFFDVLKLDDHRAGIFIADVMGHGARSALVTAILRTLLQDLKQHAGDPARFLSLLNQHFHDIVDQGDQFLFVSAFHLVIDTEKEVAVYASAGHPSPLLADRARRKCSALIDRLENNPVLGLYRDTAYTSFTSFIKKGDMFLLYTDGAIEAANPAGEDYGRHRLCKTVEDNIEANATRITQLVMDSIGQFVGNASLPDDICLLAVDVAGPRAGRATSPSSAVAVSP